MEEIHFLSHIPEAQGLGRLELYTEEVCTHIFECTDDIVTIHFQIVLILLMIVIESLLIDMTIHATYFDLIKGGITHESMQILDDVITQLIDGE